MAMKRATRRKLILLFAALSLVAAVGVLYGVRQVMTRQGLERDLREGMAAYEAQQYEEALPRLSRYVARHRDDPDVLLAFADTRRLVPAADGTSSNLKHALSITRLAIGTRPDSARGRVMLMELTAQLGLLTEANDAAAAVLEQDPTNLAAYRIRLEVAELTSRNAERIDAARRMAVALPTSFAVQSLALDHLVESEMPEDQLRTFVEERRAGVQSEMASELLAARLAGYEASVALTTEDRELHFGEFTSHLAAAIPLTPAEADEAVYLVDRLDRLPWLDLGSSADDLIQRYLEVPDLVQSFTPYVVARAWQRGDEAMLSQIAASHPDATTLDDLSLGWLAIGLPEESRLLEELRRRSTSTAEAWVRIAEATEQFQIGELAKAREGIAPLLAAAPPKPADRRGAEAMATFIDAISLQALGETGLAEQVFQELGDPPGSVWVQARSQLVEMAFRRGDYRRALELLKKDRLPATGELLLEAAVSLDESGYRWPADEDNGRVLADRTLMNFPNEPALLAFHARAELAAGNTDRAQQVAEQLAGMVTERGDPYVLRLADRLASVDGPLAARLRERWAVASSDPFEAVLAEIRAPGLTEARLRALIEQATAGGSPELLLQGGMMLAGVLDQMGNPAAEGEFVRLATENPTNARVQIAALKSAGIWDDLESVQPIITRLRSLTGEDGVSWRIFQYKLDLLKDDSDETAARVINDLSSVLRLAPNDLLALQLMAEAMTRVGDLGRAANYAALAADVAPDDLDIVLDAIEAKIRAGQMEEAAASLRGTVSKPEDPITGHLRLASLLARFGLADQALSEWTWLATVENPELQARAAVEFARLGRTDATTAIVAELMQSEDLTPVVRRLAADSLAILGRKPEGLAFLGAMTEPEDPGERVAILAQYLSRHASTPEDLQELETLVRTTDNADAWLAALRRYMGEGRPDDARRLLADASGVVDDPTKLAAFERALDPEMELDDNAFLAIAQASLLTNDTDWSRELADQLDPVISGQKSLTDLTSSLRDFVRNRPSLLLGWMLLSQAQATLGDADAARTTAQSMLRAIPADPAAARYAVDLFRRMGMADEGLLAAREFASRIGLPTLESGRDIAFFALAADRGQEAWDAISPWRADLSTNQDMSLFARAALTVGRLDDAGQIVWSRDQSELDWTREAVRMAVLIQNPPARRNWLETASTRLSSEDDLGRFVLASGWYDFALEAGDLEALKRCLSLTEADASDSGVEASLSLLQGSCLSQLGREDEAIKSYRRVLELKPENVDALNNLAYLLMEGDGPPTESLAMAQRAVGLLRAADAPPDALVAYLDTLGTALLRNNQPEEALAVFNEALGARPRYGFAIIGLAETFSALGRTEEAKQALSQFDQLDPRERGVPAQRVKAIREALP